MEHQKQHSIEYISALPTLKVVDKRYVVKDKQLGKGSFATTYLTVYKGELLACKMIVKEDLIKMINTSNHKTNTKDYLIKALKNEIRTWSKLKHPNIVAFKDLIQTQNNIYFILEYCNGGNLQNRLSKGRLKQSQAVKLFKQITDACAYLYDMGVLHRDLKPQNILLSNGQVKIADFGLSKVLEGDSKQSPEERTRAGTPYYMAPQILAGEPYNIRCDVWSLGVIFYITLYGFLPWDTYTCDNPTKLLERIKEDGVKFPAGANVGEPIKQIISSMLQLNEAQRKSIKQVKAALDQLSPMETE